MPVGPRVYACFALLFCVTVLRAGTVVVDFDSLSDLESITAQYPGLTFSNTIVLTSGAVGGMLNEWEFPPRSDYNVASDDGGPVSIHFSTPVLSFGGYFTYLVPLTLTAFDTLGDPVASTTSLFSNNLALSGDPGSGPNELMQVGFAGGIARVQIAGDALGGSFAVDDVSYMPMAPVPEPSSLGLVLLAAIGTGICSKHFIRN